ncbi:proline dehydrogenase family protein [Candidatus Bathyarchaeota archaeon]|nr:proline dehydrogenase family protein [Candidatus Bathyarchaeota archaeon]
MENLLSGLLFRIAKHWIAGETFEDAIARAQRSSVSGVRGIINLLGEETTSREDTVAATDECIKMLKELDARKIQSCISVKPTQVGLAIDKALFVQNLEKIMSSARPLGIFVWVDMEGSPFTADIVSTYLEFRKRFNNMGVAIQAYLKRSEEDVSRILDSKGIIRLCKGAYNESPEIVYKRRNQINDNFSKLMRMMFERGRGFAIASHDEKLIEEATRLSNVHHADFEFEMLMGIRDKKKLELVERGYRVSEYIPFGKSWWAYSVRRIREHKSNIFLLARSLISG